MGGVWLAWQNSEWGPFMRTHFLHTNEDWTQGRWHTMFTSSISHSSFSHLFGNMTIFILLGKKVHQLVGRARFCLLYGLGSVGGAIGNAFDPALDPKIVERGFKRYINIAEGNQPGETRGLGASDSVMAILATFYLTFPRTPVPLFRRFNLVTQ